MFEGSAGTKPEKSGPECVASLFSLLSRVVVFALGLLVLSVSLLLSVSDEGSAHGQSGPHQRRAGTN